MQVEVTVPPNTTAEVSLPQARAGTVEEDETPVDHIHGI
jgi:hypothetical protein